jgi:thymidylate synthase
MKADDAYRQLLVTLLKCGQEIETRGHKCLRVRNQMLTFVATPLVCVRKTAWKNALREWEWFMSGSNEMRDLHPSVHPWWQPWATDEASYHKPGVKPDMRVLYNYSVQFRDFQGRGCEIDQIAYLTDGVRGHPFSRRNLITTWNTAEMAQDDCPITNCHGSLVQAFVDPDNTLHLTMYQRSADVVCGVPHNWIQYWAFLLWLAKRTGREVGSFTWIGGDVHLYHRHRELALRLASVEDVPPAPTLVYRGDGDDFKADDFDIYGEYRPVITDRAEMVV